ncbi:MAG: hypothetical protein ACREPI_04425 [Candidatus Dormibacterales bacterium]
MLILVCSLAGSVLLLDGVTTIVPGKQRVHLRAASLTRFTQSRFELRVMAALESALGTLLLVAIGASIRGGWFLWLVVAYPPIIIGLLGALVFAVHQRR